MENNRKENAPNEGINLQADAVADLPVTAELANQTKAGIDPRTGNLYVGSDLGVFK